MILGEYTATGERKLRRSLRRLLLEVRVTTRFRPHSRRAAQVGDRVSIGRLSDNTCHTVENMVIKLAPVRLADDTSLLEEAIVMPGAQVSG